MNNHTHNDDMSCCNVNAHAAHGAPGMNHGSALEFLRRFWIVTFLLIPLLLTNNFFIDIFNIPTFAINTGCNL